MVLFILVTYLLGKYFNIDLDYYRAFFSRLPTVYSGIIFVILYVVVSFFAWLAKDIFKIVGALLFGAVLSSLFIFIAEIVNAIILFKLSRFLGRDFIRKILKGNLSVFDHKVDNFGFWGIFALRIVPLVPYRFLDIACGLTKISFGQYFLAVVLGSPLRIFWVQFILSAIGENFFKDPGIIMDYFFKHQGILLFSFLYAFVSIVLAILIRKYFRTSKKSNQ